VKSVRIRKAKSKAVICSIVAAAAVALTIDARASEIQTDITDFSKDNNIYTDLNEDFPNTGPGTPGSGTGTANSSFVYNPGTFTPPSNEPYASYQTPLNNGITFDLTSNSTGQDFESIGGASPAIAVGVNDVTTVYALVAAYNGQSFSVTFTGADGSTETFSDVSIPDFNGGVGNTPENDCTAVNGSLTNNQCIQTALIVQDVGAGGSGNSTTGDNNYYDLTEVSFDLDTTLSAEELSSATFTSNGYETLLLGLTTASATPVTSVPEPASMLLFGSGLGALILTRRRKKLERV